MVQDKDTAEQYTSHHSRSGSHMSSSKRSCQRQRDLEISRLKKEEPEKQHEAKLRSARQRPFILCMCVCTFVIVPNETCGSCFDKFMRTMQDKFKKLYSAKAKLEAELNNIYGEINKAVNKQDRKVTIERLIVKCKDAFTRVVDKNEELFDLAQKNEDPDAACRNIENWLEIVTKNTDEFIAAARGYINSVQDKETERYTSHHSRSGSHEFLKKIKSASTGLSKIKT